MRVLVLLAWLCALGANAANAPRPDDDVLYSGWLKMYNLNFAQAHERIAMWERTHPADPLGPVSHAAAYLFSEFARLGVLESELFIEDQTFLHRRRLQADPEVKRHFDEEVDRAAALASAALASRQDEDALLSKSLELGLRADYLAMIEKQNLAPLRYTKESRVYAERLLQNYPKNYDAYLGPGVENYLLSLKPAPVRFVLEMTGARADRLAGVNELKLTAEHGRLLAPFAKLLLAVAALRDKRNGDAQALLSELHNRFPENPLYVKELNRLTEKAAQKR